MIALSNVIFVYPDIIKRHIEVKATVRNKKKMAYLAIGIDLSNKSELHKASR
tara:strand:+ start:1859 stop:2014 length:156 start_codon:yes stop_codon:yes gene_type:complete